MGLVSAHLPRASAAWVFASAASPHGQSKFLLGPCWGKCEALFARSIFLILLLRPHRMENEGRSGSRSWCLDMMCTYAASKTKSKHGAGPNILAKHLSEPNKSRSFFISSARVSQARKQFVWHKQTSFFGARFLARKNISRTPDCAKSKTICLAQIVNSLLCWLAFGAVRGLGLHKGGKKM